MVTELDIRAAAAGEIEAMIDLADLAFHEATPPSARRAITADVDPARTRIVLDGDRVVGSSFAHGWRISVPGGELPCAAVTFVAVAPTHRRRGLLRRMMDAQIVAARERGDPLAVLWASEGGIYGRFGFGPAAEAVDLRIEAPARVVARLTPDRPPDVRLLDLDGAHALLGPIHERLRRGRAGVLSRDERWWTTRVLEDDPDRRDGAGPLRVVVAGADGYALYRTRAVEDRGRVEVSELVALTPPARRDLFAYLTGIDLVDLVVLGHRAVDDPVTLLAADGRAVARERTTDALWLRLLDVPRALEARSWTAEVSLVIEVTDDRDPLVAGRWALDAGPDGVRCARTSAEPALRLASRDLAACYLGGVGLRTLADAGLVQERSPGATCVLDAALRTARAPWTVDVF